MCKYFVYNSVHLSITKSTEENSLSEYNFQSLLFQPYYLKS
jgi:hypothetical protein